MSRSNTNIDTYSVGVLESESTCSVEAVLNMKKLNQIAFLFALPIIGTMIGFVVWQKIQYSFSSNVEQNTSQPCVQSYLDNNYNWTLVRKMLFKGKNTVICQVILKDRFQTLNVNIRLFFNKHNDIYHIRGDYYDWYILFIHNASVGYEEGDTVYVLKSIRGDQQGKPFDSNVGYRIDFRNRMNKYIPDITISDIKQLLSISGEIVSRAN